MSGAAMAEPALDHQTRFQAAVDVIHNLPKNGSYRPSYEVMLRFYSLYKQAVCGPCRMPRPAFWDPVGRYKWDAWSRLGQMSSESAMAAYVDEMKNVAQEVIDTMPMNEKTASMFHHFEPLYCVIRDMPRPPDSLLQLRDGLSNGPEQDRAVDEDAPVVESVSLTDSVHQVSVEPSVGLVCAADSGVSEPSVLTSDSESEIFCDTLDSVEQLELKGPVLNGFHKNHQGPQGVRAVGRQVGAGQGGEGASDGKGPDRSRDGGREASHWRGRGAPQGGVRRGAPGGGGGGGRGSSRGGDGSDGAPWRLHEAQLQQQIVLALQRLREDMRNVVQRLELLERLAATHALGSEQAPAWNCPACASREEKWWPFDVSAPTLLLFLLWPFVTHGLLYLLRRGHQRRSISS